MGAAGTVQPCGEGQAKEGPPRPRHSCPQQSGSTSPAQLSLCFERRKVTKLANSMVWKSWMCSHCRHDIPTLWAPEAFGKGRSLPDRGCHRDEDSSGNGPAVPGLEAPPATPSRAQGDTEGAGSAMMGSSVSTCHLPPEVKLSLVKPILQRLSPGTGPLPVSSGHCRQLPPAGCPGAAPRCPAPAGTVSPAGPGR